MRDLIAEMRGSGRALLLWQVAMIILKDSRNPRVCSCMKTCRIILKVLGKDGPSGTPYPKGNLFYGHFGAAGSLNITMCG